MAAASVAADEASYWIKARRRMSGGAAVLKRAANTNPFSRQTMSTATTDTADLAASGVSLAKMTVSDFMRTNQTEEEISRIEDRIRDMLHRTTRAIVNIDGQPVVDRIEGYTDFALSADSRFPDHAAAIRAYMAQHFDPNVYEVTEKRTLLHEHHAGFPRAVGALHTTLVIRVHAINIKYTALRYIWDRAVFGLQLAAITALCGVNAFMINYHMRYA